MDLSTISILGPGNLLRQRLKEAHLTQRKFAEEIGMRPSHVSEIVSGKRPISRAVALKLENVLGIPAEKWLNLQMVADISKGTNTNDKKATDELSKLDQIISLRIIYKKASISKSTPIQQQLIELQQFLGIKSCEDLRTNADGLIPGGFFRKSSRTGLDAKMIATWAILARVESRKTVIARPFDHNTFNAVTKELCQIFHENNNTIYRLINTLNKYGIKFCIVEKLQHASVDGYSFLENGIPTIAVTKRFDRIDYLAFSVMHELCHVYRHLTSTNDQRLNLGNDDFSKNKEEDEANKYAADALISDDKWQNVPPVKLNNPWEIQKCYTQWAVKNKYNKWIVLGRISHETGMYKFKSDSSRTIN